MDTPAPLVVGTRGNIMVFSPAGIEFCTIHLFSWRTSIPGGNNRIVLINNNRAEIASQAGALMRTPGCQIQKIVVPVSSHSEVYVKDLY
jgi:hypothetical protein